MRAWSGSVRGAKRTGRRRTRASVTSGHSPRGHKPAGRWMSRAGRSARARVMGRSGGVMRARRVDPSPRNKVAFSPPPGDPCRPANADGEQEPRATMGKVPAWPPRRNPDLCRNERSCRRLDEGPRTTAIAMGRIARGMRVTLPCRRAGRDPTLEGRPRTVIEYRGHARSARSAGRHGAIRASSRRGVSAGRRSR